MSHRTQTAGRRCSTRVSPLFRRNLTRTETPSLSRFPSLILR